MHSVGIDTGGSKEFHFGARFFHPCSLLGSLILFCFDDSDGTCYARHVVELLVRHCYRAWLSRLRLLTPAFCASAASQKESIDG
jgi:hypothetical protein